MEIGKVIVISLIVSIVVVLVVKQLTKQVTGMDLQSHTHHYSDILNDDGNPLLSPS